MATPSTDPAAAAGERARGRAAAAIELHRFEEAAREAGQAIAAEPTHSEGYALLAQARLGLEDLAGSKAAAEEGLKQSPANEWLLRLRATALLHLGDAKTALAVVEQVLADTPRSPLAHSLRGRCLEKLKRRDEARAAFQEGIALAPNVAHLHRELADLIEEKDPVAAEKGYRRALELSPNDAVTLNNLGVALQRQKRVEEANYMFRAAILIDPTMKQAKQNAHRSIGSLARVATGGAVAGLVLVRALVQIAAGTRGLASLEGPAAVGVPFLLVCAGAAYFWRRKRNKEAAAREMEKHPQLKALFERLDADKKAGRF